jgi:hypothetical protein
MRLRRKPSHPVTIGPGARAQNLSSTAFLVALGLALKWP